MCTRQEIIIHDQKDLNLYGVQFVLLSHLTTNTYHEFHSFLIRVNSDLATTSRGSKTFPSTLFVAVHNIITVAETKVSVSSKVTGLSNAILNKLPAKTYVFVFVKGDCVKNPGAYETTVVVRFRTSTRK